MVFLIRLTPALLGLLLTACTGRPQPPVAKIEPHIITAHGHTRIDNYYWMNHRDSADVLDYLEQENSYANAVMRGTEPLQAAIFNELKDNLTENTASEEYIKSGHRYYVRYEKDQSHPVYCRQPVSRSSGAREEILLNVNELARGHAYYKVSEYAISPNNRYMVFAADTVSRRLYTLYVKDLQTGLILPGGIPETSGSAIWANDNKTLFYTIKDPVSLRSYKVMRHLIADVSAQPDVCVFEEDDPVFSVSIEEPAVRDVILISSYSKMTDEYWYIDANHPHHPPRVIQPRIYGLRYYTNYADGKFYIRTNHEAVNFRLMEAPLARPALAHWKDILPSDPQTFVQNVMLFKDYVVVVERNNGLERIRSIQKSDKSTQFIDFDNENYVVSLESNADYSSNYLKYRYSSLTAPESVYGYDLRTGKSCILFKENSPNYRPDDYCSQRIWATALDGTEIPISLVYKNGTPLDGSAPLLLYGYGAYSNTSVTRTYFNANRLPLLNRGFIYAIAHVRGGGYLGREWYQGGRLLNKRNSFTDFIACAEHLVQQKYTSTNNLVIKGLSAGGLLVGAVANMRPDLFKCIVANVPFVDVLTTQLDETLPLAAVEYQEWGNGKLKEEYDYMLSYSPYDNVQAQEYPNMLVTTGYHDSQVQYFEPAKWVAKLRTLKTDKNTLLFKTNMHGGHSGGAGRFDTLKDLAFEYAFMIQFLIPNS